MNIVKDFAHYMLYSSIPYYNQLITDSFSNFPNFVVFFSSPLDMEISSVRGRYGWIFSGMTHYIHLYHVIFIN